jgi:DNA-directed RNA polymerase subunit RPC12/RpoP
VDLETEAPKARCVHCRSEVTVPASYAHRDHIKCPDCGTRHRISRGEVLRLVLADVAPLKEALESNRQLVDRLQNDLQATTMSFGLAANGLVVGVLYFFWRAFLEGAPVTLALIVQALGLSLLSAVIIEIVNYLFLGKRRRLNQLTAEIEEARADANELQQKIREAGRV